MEFFGKHRLAPHPEQQPGSVASVEVEVVRQGNSIVLTYSVEPTETVIFPAFAHERRDNLWRGTCFELFVRPERGGYVEFNFAPLSAWNAYSFTDWRMGRRPYQPDREPRITDSRLDGNEDASGSYHLQVVLSGDLLLLAPAEVSIVAIIEEEGGKLSYWALAHPPGSPNFHHPDCFVARLA
jgi:hypothetical protein